MTSHFRSANSDILNPDAEDQNMAKISSKPSTSVPQIGNKKLNLLENAARTNVMKRSSSAPNSPFSAKETIPPLHFDVNKLNEMKKSDLPSIFKKMSRSSKYAQAHLSFFAFSRFFQFIQFM